MYRTLNHDLHSIIFVSFLRMSVFFVNLFTCIGQHRKEDKDFSFIKARARHKVDQKRVCKLLLIFMFKYRTVGSDIEKDETVLERGTLLGPSEIGLAAAVGVNKINVYRTPHVAVLSTGNEVRFSVYLPSLLTLYFILHICTRLLIQENQFAQDKSLIAIVMFF